MTRWTTAFFTSAVVFALSACAVRYRVTSDVEATPDDAGASDPVPDAEVPAETDSGAPATWDASAPDCGTGALPAGSVSIAFAETVLKRWPAATQINGSTPAFEYNRGIVLRGIERVYELTHDAKYLDYIKNYVDTFIDTTGKLNIPAAHSFDNMQPSIFFTLLWKETGDTKYQLAAEKMRARYDTIPRGPSGGFWHKSTYPNQMWLDSIYMGQPFLARYGSTFNCGTYCFDTVAQQISLIAQHTQDPATGLLYHAWDESGAASWALPGSGRSSYVWGRALGWFVMSLVDILIEMPVDHPTRPATLQLLQKTAAAIKTYQDPTTGLWYQVVDQASASGNWLETSGSGMFVYALKRAVAHGLIDPSYLDVAQRGWAGVQTKITYDSVGPVITGAVQGMGVQTSFSNYVNQSRLSNSSHGLCAVLLAATAMEADCR